MTLDHHKFDESKYTLVDAKTRLILTEELKRLQAKADMAERMAEVLETAAIRFELIAEGTDMVSAKIGATEVRTVLQAWNELKEMV